MNAPVKIKPAEVGTDIVVLTADMVVAEPKRGEVVLFDREAYDQFEAKLREDLKDFVPDLTTVAGRKAIASKAFEVTKVKTTLDRQAKELTEEWRTRTNAVNAGRRIVVDRLDALAAEVRKPLTDWEEAEKARIAECDATINRIVLAGVVTIEDTAATVRERGAEIWGIEIDPERYGDKLAQATTAKSRTVEQLKAALARLTKAEDDAARLARLEAEKAEREAREQAEREERERQEREAEEARQAEQRRLDNEKAEAKRIERAKEEAAQVERDRLQREHDEEIAAERRRADEAERAAQAERDRIAAEERERVAAAEAEAAAQREREANQAHRTEVKTKAKQALMTCGADEEVARKIVMAILAGEVPAVRIEF